VGVWVGRRVGRPFRNTKRNRRPYLRLTHKGGIAPLLNRGVLVLNDEDKALILNDHFISVGRPDDGLCPNLKDFTPCQSIMSDVKFDAVNVLKQINKLKINSSPGPDNIPSVLLKM